MLFRSFETLEATEAEMEQPYWATIHHDLADGIQFVENHGVIESTEGSPQRLAKKRRRFSRVLNTQIRIPVPHPPTSPARPSHPLPPPPPPAAAMDDSPSPLPPTPSAAVVDDSPCKTLEFVKSYMASKMEMLMMVVID